jgi:hypothetical protein
MSDVKANAKALFLEALERQGGEELLRFLDEACGGDSALRARVEELLRAHHDAGSFLEPPAPRPVATVAEAPVTERPGTVVGLYKLLQQIGEGGMGTVWMAEQTEPVKRLVAVKLIKAGMERARVGRRTIYYAKEQDADFAAAWDEALEEFADSLEKVAIGRARRKSDKLLMLLLAANRPDKYRRKQDVPAQSSPDVNVHVHVVAARVTQYADLYDQLAAGQAPLLGGPRFDGSSEPLDT